MKKILLIGSMVCAGVTNAQNLVGTNGNRNVLLEYSAAVGVPQMPDADSQVRKIRIDTSAVICAALHFTYSGFTDAMEISDNTAYLTTFISGYPRGTVDRAITPLSAAPSGPETDRDKLSSAVYARLAVAPGYDLTMRHTYDPITRALTVQVSGKALKTMTGDYHFNVYVVEDSVKGIGATYDQRNFYNATVGHPFFGKGNPITGYTHMQVVRAMLGGTWGTLADTNPAIYDSTSVTFNYTLPAGYKEKDIYLVGIAAKYGTGAATGRVVENAVKANLTACVQPAKVQMCGASYDVSTGRNVITWDKTGLKNVFQYKVYREGTAAGQYMLLHTQPADSVASFTDQLSNPIAFSYNYKVTTVDSCNREMPVDSFTAHKTMLLTITPQPNKVVKLDWNLYQGNAISTHHIMRSINGGTYQSIGQAAANATTFSDMSAPDGFLSYRVEIPNASACALPFTSSNAATVSVGVSNVYKNEHNIRLYPNPVSDIFTVDGLSKDDVVILMDLAARELKRWDMSMVTKQVFSTGGISAGMYFLNVYDKHGLAKASLKLQHQ